MAKTETPKAPGYASRREKRAHEKLDQKFHHGGRTETPDEDVNPAKRLQVEEDEKPRPAKGEKGAPHPPRKGAGGPTRRRNNPA